MIDLPVVSGVWMLFENRMGRAELGVPLGEYRRKVPPLPKNYYCRVKEVESWPD